MFDSRDEALREAQGLADALGPGWVPWPDWHDGGKWRVQADNSSLGLMVTKVTRDGVVGYIAVADLVGGGASPRESVASMQRGLERLVESLKAAEGAS